jgi:protein TonB
MKHGIYLNPGHQPRAGARLGLVDLPQMMSRNVLIAGSVITLHIAALWAMQTGLLRRAVELVVPAEILVEFISPPAPKVVPPPPAPQKPTPVKQPRKHCCAAPSLWPLPTPPAQCTDGVIAGAVVAPSRRASRRTASLVRVVAIE